MHNEVVNSCMPGTPAHAPMTMPGPKPRAIQTPVGSLVLLAAVHLLLPPPPLQRDLPLPHAAPHARRHLPPPHLRVCSTVGWRQGNSLVFASEGLCSKDMQTAPNWTCSQCAKKGAGGHSHSLALTCSQALPLAQLVAYPDARVASLLPRPPGPRC